MGAEAAREFVDANLFVYAHDASAGRKKSAAERVIARLWASGTGCVSVQVLQEFFVTVTTKVAVPLSSDEAAARIREIGAWQVFAPGVHDVLHAIALRDKAKLSLWDAMVVHAAIELGCGVLWTEDMNDGQLIAGVRIRNPFTSADDIP